MTKRAVQDLIEMRPFRPFAVRMTNGRLVQVDTENEAVVHPVENTMIVFTGGGYRILDIALLSEVNLEQGPGAPLKPK